MILLVPSDFREVVGEIPTFLCALCKTQLPSTGRAFTDTRGNWVHFDCVVEYNKKEAAKPYMTIDELVSRSYQQAVEGGWAQKEVPVPEQVALICSEACEALEEFRNGKPTSYDGPDGKPEGIGPEYADILIRIGHYARLNDIDLTYEVTRKLAYNKTRPHRHGGKLA